MKLNDFFVTTGTARDCLCGSSSCSTHPSLVRCCHRSRLCWLGLWMAWRQILGKEELWWGFARCVISEHLLSDRSGWLGDWKRSWVHIWGTEVSLALVLAGDIATPWCQEASLKASLCFPAPTPGLLQPRSFLEKSFVQFFLEDIQ